MTECSIDVAGATIVIPTYERPRQINRLLACYAREAPELPILVADSSAEPSVPKQAMRAGLTYWHCPGLQIVPKLRQSVDRVRTAFTILCPDDYLIVPSAIEACRAFLLAHHDFAAVEGFSLALTRVFGRNVFTNYAREGLRFQASAPTALERIDYLLDPANYYGLFYSCQRTETSQHIWSLIDAADLQSPYLVEYVCVALLTISGKTTVLPTLHALITGFVFRKTSRYSNINSIIRGKSPEFLLARDLVARAAAEKDGLTEEVCRERVSRAFERFNHPVAPRSAGSTLDWLRGRVVAGFQKPFYLLGREDLLKTLLLFVHGCREVIQGPRRARQELKERFGVEMDDPRVRGALDDLANRLFAG